MTYFERVVDDPRTEFLRICALAAILALGVLAYIGLHRDIGQAANPCVSDTNSLACAHYACGIAQYTDVPASAVCLRIEGPRQTQVPAD